MPHHASRPAFTLIEVIVVILIVAILSVVAAPRLSNLGSSRAGVAARSIARDLTYARERAIATGTRTWVVFSPSTHSYSVLSENPASPGRVGATTLTDPNGTGRPFVQYLNTGEFAGVTMASAVFGSGSEVGFDWVGKPYSSSTTALSANGAVTLSSGYSVTVEASTGLAKVLP